MREYLTRFMGKRVGITRAGILKEVFISGILKEITGEVAVIVTDDNIEIGIPLNMIVAAGPPDQNVGGRSAGFIGD
jgi:hypothetical protein